MSFWNGKEAEKLFQELPFYVLIEKPKIKHFDELNVVELSQEFKGCARSYNIEIMDLKDH